MCSSDLQCLLRFLLNRFLGTFRDFADDDDDSFEKDIKSVESSDRSSVRLSTSAPAGDPDLYPRVYRLTESIPRFGQVIRHR